MKLIKIIIYIFTFSILYAQPSNENINWQQLLSQKKYEKIDLELQNIENIITKNPSYEEKLMNALYLLTINRSLDNNIKEYVKTKPNSANSHLLLGLAYLLNGLDARGYGWVNETPKENLKKMEEFLVKANRELLKSIELNDTIASSYSVLITSYSYSGKDEKKDEIYKKGIKKLPNSYIIRNQYMRVSLLKWGGSFEKIESLLKDAKAHYKENNLLKKLKGFTNYAKADYYYRQKQDPSKGLEQINKALKVSDNKDYYLLRGRIYKQLKDYSKALDDFNKILNKHPLDLTTLISREAVYFKLDKYDLAFKDAQTVLKYDKNSAYSYYIRGAYYYSKKEYDFAKLDFFKSIELDNKNKGAKVYLGFCYYIEKNYNEASTYLKEAIEDGYKGSDAHYYLTVSLWHNKDCEFVKSAYNYKERCTQNDDCKQNWLDWAIKSANFAKARGICKG